MKLLNAYQVLGVDLEAQLPEIKKAFRMRVREFHPDLHPHQSEEAFIQLRRAYEVLLCPKLREEQGFREQFPIHLSNHCRTIPIGSLKPKARLIEVWA